MGRQKTTRMKTQESSQFFDFFALPREVGGFILPPEYFYPVGAIMEKDGSIGPIPNPLAVFAVIIIVAIGILFVAKGMRKPEYNTFTSKKYGFSFSYPSGWIIENRQSIIGIMVSVRSENTPFQEMPNAQVQVLAGSLGMPSLDNIRELVSSEVENNENLTIIIEPKDITIEDVPGLDFTLKAKSSQDNIRMRQLILTGENFDYNISSATKENSYEEFKSNLERIFESFTLLGK